MRTCLPSCASRPTYGRGSPCEVLSPHVWSGEGERCCSCYCCWRNVPTSYHTYGCNPPLDADPTERFPHRAHLSIFFHVLFPAGGMPPVIFAPLYWRFCPFAATLPHPKNGMGAPVGMRHVHTPRRECTFVLIIFTRHTGAKIYDNRFFSIHVCLHMQMSRCKKNVEKKQKKKKKVYLRACVPFENQKLSN